MNPWHCDFLKRIKKILAALACLSFASIGVAQSVIEVPPGDSDAFLSAIASANSSVLPTIIRLDSRAEYRLDLSRRAPASITSNIVLLGNGAHITGMGEGSFGRLFNVRQGATLNISNLVIRDFTTGERTTPSTDKSFLSNSGNLWVDDLRIEHITALAIDDAPAAILSNSGFAKLYRVRIVDVEVSVLDPGRRASIVFNTGDLTAENLFIAEARLSSASADNVGNYIGNFGPSILDLRYSTLIAPSDLYSSVPNLIGISGAGGLGVHPRNMLKASMVVNLHCPWGFPNNGSKGFNLITSPDCGGKPSDLIGVSPGPVALRRSVDGGSELALPIWSPAVDRVTGPETDCPSSDASGKARFQDGNYNGEAACDIGAFERQGGQDVLAGGATGLYYSAGSDGHYVTIEEVRPDEYVIFWNTFDLDGNHVWVFAQGFREGNEIAAFGYYQSEGILIPGAGADVNTDALLDWGRLWITLDDCLGGSFRYVSELPQFGSGNFRLDRLALVDALGCSD